MLLKLEKGLKFGDASAVTGIDVINKKPQLPNHIISTSLFKEIKQNEKTVCVISTPDCVQNYKKYYIPNDDEEKEKTKEIGEKSVAFLECENSKDIMEQSCNSISKYNMTICHLDAKTVEDENKRSIKVKKWTKKMWLNTPNNGLYVTVWTGTATKHGFIGIAINKSKNMVL